MLLVHGALGQGEVAVRHVASGTVDLGQQVRLAQRAVGRDGRRPVQGVAHPQVAGVFVQKRATLGCRAAHQQPVHGRAVQLARTDDVRSLQHPDDPPDRAPGLLPLDAQDVLGHLGGDRPALATVLAVLGKQSLEAAVAVGVVPSLDRARFKLDPPAVRPLVGARRGLAEVASPVPVFESRAHQRTEHAQPPQGDRLLVIVLHGPCCSRDVRPLLGGSFPSSAAVPDGAAKGHGYMRRTFGCSR